MDAVTATTQMTAAEFLALPESTSASRMELIDGEIVVSEATRRHNGAQGWIYSRLSNWVAEATRRGWVGFPLDVDIDERNVHAPDVVWYREGRVPAMDDPPPYPVPDLVVEVRSPSTWRYDIGAKKRNYEEHGVAELWLVDTFSAVVFAFRRSAPAAPHFDVALELGGGEMLTSPLLPGFSLAVGEIFADG
jgi:Uma2 family endonuclease